MNKWQPIDTAPKDGTRVLIYQPDGAWQSHARNRRAYIDAAYWHQPGNPDSPGFWCASAIIGYRPTHWMPLPDPPAPHHPADPGK